MMIYVALIVILKVILDILLLICYAKYMNRSVSSVLKDSAAFPKKIYRKVILHFKNWNPDLKLERGGWYDADYRMEQCVIVLFIDYVENECGGLNGKYFGFNSQIKIVEYADARKKHIKELIAAYKYFKKNPDAYGFVGSKNYEERKKHLDVIWNYRGYLWT